MVDEHEPILAAVESLQALVEEAQARLPGNPEIEVIITSEGFGLKIGGVENFELEFDSQLTELAQMAGERLSE